MCLKTMIDNKIENLKVALTLTNAVLCDACIYSASDQIVHRARRQKISSRIGKDSRYSFVDKSKTTLYETEETVFL